MRIEYIMRECLWAYPANGWCWAAVLWYCDSSFSYRLVAVARSIATKNKNSNNSKFQKSFQHLLNYKLWLTVLLWIVFFVSSISSVSSVVWKFWCAHVVWLWIFNRSLILFWCCEVNTHDGRHDVIFTYTDILETVNKAYAKNCFNSWVHLTSRRLEISGTTFHLEAPCAYQPAI